MLASFSDCMSASWVLASCSLETASSLTVWLSWSMCTGRHISLSARPLKIATACSRQVS